MGLPAGWVTGVPGLPYAAKIRALGNGVVPRQATAALHLLIPRVGFLPTTGSWQEARCTGIAA